VIDGKGTCNGQEVEHVTVSVDVFPDMILTLVTATIYSPNTVRIWCRQTTEKEG